MDTRVLFFTGFPADNYADLCLNAGGLGIVSKHLETLDELALAVRHVARGERYFCSEVAERLVRLEKGGYSSPLATLTDRERQVLIQLATGAPNRKIASGLDISLRSVEKDIAELKRKLGKSSTNELLIYAAREGLVYPELSGQPVQN